MLLMLLNILLLILIYWLINTLLLGKEIYFCIDVFYYRLFFLIYIFFMEDIYMNYSNYIKYMG
jgi:hypothetical protein